MREAYDAAVVSPVVVPPQVAGPLRLCPFRAVTLSASRVGDPATSRLFARPSRVVATRLAQWESRGELTRDAHPALYLHEYTAGGLTVRGVVGALDVSRRAIRFEDRAVLPHEGIHPGQADDLADRMQQTQLNPTPILLVYQAPDAVRDLIDRRARQAPDRQLVDRAGQHHRVWAVRDPNDLDVLEVGLAHSHALIADGHHRYAAYLRLQQRMPGGATDRGLAMLVDRHDSPLFLGAIHRVLGGVSLTDLQAAAQACGVGYHHESRADALAALGPTHLVATDGHTWAVLDLNLVADRAAVEVLHDQLIPALPRGPHQLSYHHSVADLLTRTGRLRDTSVLVPALSVDLVMRITAQNRLLPEKATSFQPKPSAGMLVRSLSDG